MASLLRAIKWGSKIGKTSFKKLGKVINKRAGTKLSLGNTGKIKKLFKNILKEGNIWRIFKKNKKLLTPNELKINDAFEKFVKNTTTYKHAAHVKKLDESIQKLTKVISDKSLKNIKTERGFIRGLGKNFYTAVKNHSKVIALGAAGSTALYLYLDEYVKNNSGSFLVNKASDGRTLKYVKLKNYYCCEPYNDNGKKDHPFDLEIQKHLITQQLTPCSNRGEYDCCNGWTEARLSKLINGDDDSKDDDDVKDDDNDDDVNDNDYVNDDNVKDDGVEVDDKEIDKIDKIEATLGSDTILVCKKVTHLEALNSIAKNAIDAIKDFDPLYTLKQIAITAGIGSLGIVIISYFNNINIFLKIAICVLMCILGYFLSRWILTITD